MAVIHIGLFWRRFRFSFRAYSFLQQLRLMRRKRCSRPSLKESTSGRCNYDLTCYFSFLSHFYFFPPFSSFLFFRLFLFLSHFSNEGRIAQRKWGNVFSSVTMKLATKPCRCCIQTRALSLSLSRCLSVFLSILVGRGEVKLFDVRTTVFFLLSRSVSFHVDDFGDEFCRVFEFSNVVLRSRARYFEYILAIQATRGKI